MAGFLLRLGGGIFTQSSSVEESGEYADLPQTTMDVTYPSITGTTTTLTGSGTTALQTAIDTLAALTGSLNHELVLDAGSTWTGNYTLPVNAGSGWKIIRTAGTIPAVGTRVATADATQMAKLVSSNTSQPLITALSSSCARWRVVGLEITSTDNPDELLNFGRHTGQTLANMAQYCIADRCYIHTRSGGSGKSGVRLHCAHGAVINSIVSVFSATWGDTTGVWGWNGLGPFHIENNRIEATGEAFGYGGDDPTITNLLPSDMTFKRNFCTKPDGWLASYINKTIIDIKVGRRILIDSNILEKQWNDGQAQNHAIVLKSVNQLGAATWNVTEHVTVRNNIVRNSTGAFNLQARPEHYSSGGARTCLPANHINVYNNLFYDIGESNGTSTTWQIILTQELDVIRFANNTFHSNYPSPSSDGGWIVVDNNDANLGDLYLENNVVSWNTYGMHTSFGSGHAGLPTVTDGEYTYEGNVLVQNGFNFAMTNHTGNTKANSYADAFTDVSTDDYTLKAAFQTSGTGGTLPGADIPAILTATAGVDA